MIPVENIDGVVEHVVLVHESVGEFSKRFLQKLRRSNYVTPKNYLDFINTYSKLLDEKTQCNIGKTWERGGEHVRIQLMTFSLSRRFLARRGIIRIEVKCSTLRIFHLRVILLGGQGAVTLLLLFIRVGSCVS